MKLAKITRYEPHCSATISPPFHATALCLVTGSGSPSSHPNPP